MPPEHTARTAMTRVLCLVFFCSGASALMFENLWFHQAGIALGNGVWASSLVLAGFMGGLALGNGLAARYGDRWRRPVRAYAALEIVIALAGLALVFVLPVLGGLLGPALEPVTETPWLLNAMRLTIAFALLLAPSTAMGMTLPILTKALTGADQEYGRALGLLYGFNTLGALAGVVLAEFVLVEAIGIRGTGMAAATLNLGAAAAAFALSRTLPAPALEEPGPLRMPDARVAHWVLAAFGCGGAVLALEVVWFRFLTLFVTSHAASFAVMLATVLAGIAIGGLVGGALAKRLREAHGLVPSLAFASATLCVVCYSGFRWLVPDAPTELAGVSAVIELAVPLMFPLSLVSGVLFTLLGVGLRAQLTSETATTGVLTLANTLGAALGSLVAGFVLLPMLGMERSFFAVALLYAFIGVALLLRTKARGALVLVSGVTCVLALALFPFGLMAEKYFTGPLNRYSNPGTRGRVEIREGLTETILYVEHRRFGGTELFRMITNGYSMSATDFHARRYMKLYTYWPMAVRPDIERALMISYGVGSTAKSLVDTRSLTSIDIVDISRDVLEMNEIVYPDPADHPLEDPRVKVHVEDGRWFLQTTRERFDLITGEPPPPRVAGVVNLYTREYFELIKSRLNPGGIVSYWLPIHSMSDTTAKSILRGFCGAFDDCSLWHGMGRDLMMVGFNGHPRRATAAEFSAQWADERVGAELRSLGFETPAQLGALFIGDADYLREVTADALPLDDDHPKRVLAPGSTANDPGRPATLPELYASFIDTPAARTRFEHSSLIAEIWPEPLRAEALDYFEHQAVLNRVGFTYQSSRQFGLEPVRRMLEDTSLREAPLWLLGSSPDLQRIAADARADPLERGPLAFHVALRALAERRYTEAAAAFAHHGEDPELRVRAGELEIFALALAGRKPEARRRAHRLLERTGGESYHAQYWPWMQHSFGVPDPVQSEATRSPAPDPGASESRP